MKNLFKLTLATHLLLILTLPVFVFAQQTTFPNPPAPGGANTPPTPFKIEIPTFLNPNITDVPTLLTVIIDNIVIPIGSIIAVLMIMYAGFQFVTAQGNSSKISDAKNTLINAAIGSAILLGAKVIAEVVKATITKL